MPRELKTLNPATEEVVDTYQIMTKEQINDKTRKAQNAFLDWNRDIHKRADSSVRGHRFRTYCECFRLKEYRFAVLKY